MKEHWNAALVSLVPEFLELRSIQVVTADVRYGCIAERDVALPGPVGLRRRVHHLEHRRSLHGCSAVRGDEHADEAQLVQAARHLFQQCIHIVEGKVSERFEPPWVAKAGTRKPIVHQPAKFGEMVIEGSVEWRTGKDLNIYPSRLYVLDPQGIIPRGEGRTSVNCIRPAHRILFVVNYFWVVLS